MALFLKECHKSDTDAISNFILYVKEKILNWMKKKLISRTLDNFF